MVKNSSFEITEVSGEYMAIPVGDATKSLNGIVALNEASAYLLQQMSTSKTKTELIDLLTQQYEVDQATATKDVDAFVAKLMEIGLIVE